MIVRRAFPQIYEYDHPKSGRYWLVSARRPKWNLNERKTFSVKKLAEEYADGIEQRFLDSGRQVEIPKEKVVMVKSYEQLAEKVGNYGVSVEEAIDHFMRYKGDEIVRGAKPFIRDLVEQWKTFKNSKTGLSSKFVTEIRSYARFIKRQWGDLKPEDLKRNDIELMLNKLDVSNNTRRKYLLIIRMFLKWLVDEGHLSKKPTDGIRIKADDFNGEFYTPAETKQFLRYARRDRASLRRSEIPALIRARQASQESR